MNILITGGAGFIASNLIPPLLNEGYSVTVIDNLSHGTYVQQVHDKTVFHQADCRNKDEVERIVSETKPDVTFMFHGLVSIYDCHKDPCLAIDNNLKGSINVFDALVKHKCPRVIFAETSAVYENCPLPEGGYTEDQCDPVTMYAVTKASLRMIASSYAKLHGLKYTALRYFNVAGAMQDYRRTVPPLFAGVALRLLGGNSPIVFGDGNRRRDFIHVDDINSFHLQCMHDERTVNEVFNLGMGKSTSIYEIGHMIGNELGHLLVNFKHLPEINGEAFEIKANIDKAKSLGWTPKKTLRDCIVDTINYVEEQCVAGYVDPATFMNNLDVNDVKI